MQPRYFIGITLPDELRHAVGKVQHELFIPHKIMEPLRPHITLLHPDTLATLHPLYFVPKIKELADKILPIEEFKSRIEPLVPTEFTATYLTQFKWLRPRVYKITEI